MKGIYSAVYKINEEKKQKEIKCAYILANKKTPLKLVEFDTVKNQFVNPSPGYYFFSLFLFF